ncbi:MAG: ATP synthase F1 subunit gamma [Bacteroidales bacterium]|nr:ATP synthase F1 subunit gamma [Bacteroidales bacterium]MBR1799838.1 ATP synthase F1 subunit gamma [Bacteroidales bacterium]
MANLKEVRTRISSVSSTQQITSAMKMVSAAKFRRAQNAIIGMRPYANRMNEISSSIGIDDHIQSPYQVERKPLQITLVVVTSNKGLCGAFNSNVIKLANQRISHYRKITGNGGEITILSIGKKASEFFSKQSGVTVEVMDDLLDGTTFDKVASLADTLMTRFSKKETDLIEVIYNQFKNSLSQTLSCEQFLPVVPQAVTNLNNKKTKQDIHYLYEPSKAQMLQELIPLTLRSSLYRIILDSLAAEHGARMTAMQKATDNATELLKDLRLSYNKARQAAITNEIIEIVSGSEALKG